MNDNEVRVEEQSSIIISSHAYQRLRERNGWNKKTADRMIKKISAKGIKSNEVKGYKKIWLSYKGFEETSDDRVILCRMRYGITNEVLLDEKKRELAIKRVNKGTSKKQFTIDDYREYINNYYRMPRTDYENMIYNRLIECPCYLAHLDDGREYYIPNDMKRNIKEE